MARKILVADRDPAYAQALARRIQKHCPACEVATASNESDFQKELAQSAGDLSLVVSAAHFPIDSLPAGVSQLILLETTVGPEDRNPSSQPIRLGPVQPILERLAAGGCTSVGKTTPETAPDPAASPAPMPAMRIEDPMHWFADPEHSFASSLHSFANPAQSVDPAQPVANSLQMASMPAASDPARPCRVILMLTQTISGRHPAYADQRCQTLVDNGERITYLPLMPNYYCRFAIGCGSENGFGLTNLILRIAGGGMTASELGAYMAIDRLGRMQVRPCDRADDLLECQPHPLFQLVMLVRERVLTDPKALLVIEAAGIPFRSVQAIMPLCDAVEVIMPEDDGYAGQSLRRELADVLAELPPGAQVTQAKATQANAMQAKATQANAAQLKASRHVPA